MMLGGYMDEAATNFGNSSFHKIPYLLGLEEAYSSQNWGGPHQ
jgi:hypothetical protein